MKIVYHAVAILLGLLFVFAGVSYFLIEPPAPPEGSAIAHFSAAFMDTGYMTFVKVLEIAGGLLLLVPRTRVAGLLILLPILVNIVAFHAFVTKGEGLVGIPLVALLAGAFLAWRHRRGVAALLGDRG